MNSHIVPAEAQSESLLTLSGLDPALASLGEMVGLLEKTGDDTYQLIDSWFADPIGHISAAVSGNGDALAKLLTQMLGSVGGQALGVPIKDPALLGTWYPINNPQTKQPTGLFVVSYPDASGTGEVFGVGVHFSRALPDDNPAITVTVWGMIPILGVGIGGGSVKAVLTEQGYPITLGAAVEGKDGGALVDVNGLSFTGVKVSAGLDIAAAAAGSGATKPPLQLSIVVMQLALPDDTKPEDRSLADLEAISAQEIQDTAAALFIAALGEVMPAAAKEAQYLLPLLGLSTRVPESTTALQLLAWEELFALAAAHGDVAAPFRAWFRTLASHPDQLQAWIACVAGVMTVTTSVGGDGSRAKPFSVPILDLSSNPAIGVLSFTVGSTVDPDGKRHVFPGLAFAAAPLKIGSSPAVLRIESEIELAQFVVADDASVGVGPPSSLDFTMGLTLANAQADQPLAAVDGYAFGTFQAGLALSNVKPVPRLALTGIVTPNGSYDSIDLLSPGQLAQAAENILLPMIDAQLKKLLGIASGTVPFASNAAALLGITAPDVTGWPVPPPFALAQLPTSVQDPLGALGGYYWTALTWSTPVEGQPAFTYMVKELAGLLQSADMGGATVTVSGSGTAASPWLASLALHDKTLPAMLAVYAQPAGDVTQLVLGLRLAPQLTLGSTIVVPSVEIDLLTLDLPKPNTGAAFGGVWASNIGASIALPDGFASDPVGGASLSIKEASLSAGWSRSSGWACALHVGKPSITIDGQTIALGADLDFADLAALQDLVTKEVPAFLNLVTGVVGVALLRSKTRAGLALVGALGLLKDLQKAPNFPSNLQWPAIPTLTLTGFQDPRPALWGQVARDLASDDTARAVLSLVGFALDGSLTKAPDIAGTRAFAAPFKVPVASTGFELVVWSGDSPPVVGLGLGRTLAQTVGSVQITGELRLNAVELSLADGSLQSGGNAPSFSVLTTIAASSGLLVPGSAALGSLGSVTIGISVALADGAPVVTPVVDLIDVTLPGETQAKTITLADFQQPAFEDRLKQAFLALLNQGIARLTSTAVAQDPSFKTLYALLQATGLAIPRTGANDPYGINPAGWQALLADPTGFAISQLEALLTDVNLRTQFFDYLQGLLGITLPTIPLPVLDVLRALNILGAPELGYPLQPKAILQLAQQPLPTLAAAFETFINDPAAVKALATDLAGVVKVPPIGPFSFSATAGTTISLGIAPAAAVAIGDAVKVWGALSLDLAARSVSLSVDIYSPRLGLALAPSLSFRPGVDAAPTVTAALAWGDGTRPAPPPLGVYPFDAARFVDQVKDLAPTYVLSTFATIAIESQLIEKYPLAQKIFSGLGMAAQADGSWSMPSLLGLLHDPKGWLLSEGVLGADGKFSVAGFIALLKNLPPATSANGVALAPTATGATLSGLPYNVAIALGGQDGVASFAFSASKLSVANGAGMLEELSIGLTLGPDYQPGFTGTLQLATGTKAPTPFAVAAGYDAGFSLSVSQGTHEAGISLQILPFQGWGSLLEATARQLPAALLNELVPRLLDALEKGGAADFVKRLREAGGDLQVADLVTALTKVTPFDAAHIEQAALTWLLDRLSSANAPQTAKAIETLLQSVLPTQVKATGGFVEYKPSPKLPLTLRAGTDSSGAVPVAGVWALLELPESSLIRVGLAPTGIGVPLQGEPKPVFSFGAEVAVPIEGDTGPQLSLTYAPATGFELLLDPLGSVASNAQASALCRELLPQFFPAQGNDKSDLGARVLAWLEQVAIQVLPRYVAAIVLNRPLVHDWLDKAIVATAGAPTPGEILLATSLLKKPSNKYALNDLAALQALTLESFAANFLKTLLQTPLKLLTFGADKKGEIWIGPNPNDAGAFGIRLAAPDFAVPKLAHVRLQLGATDDEWIGKSGGGSNLAPGLAVYVPIDELKPDFSRIQINAINVGLDFVGTDNAPLVNFKRFQLGAVSPRVLLELDINGGSPTVTFGGGAVLQNIAISLAPDSLPGAGGNTNPVAQNLLGSGSGTSKNNPPANPTFSVSAAYTKNLWVHLSSSTSSGEQIVFPVQRSFGPLHVNSIGIGWQDTGKLLQMLFDGSVALAGLEADVNQLTVGIPVTDITNFSAYQLDLQGLDISFKGGAVAISGGLLKTTDPLSYTGAMLVKAANFSLVAVGAYTLMPTTSDPHGPTAPSLFVFGALTTPLGGPPAFFVNGIAAGFGYNRSITLPDIGDVQNFPLVSGVVKGTFSEGEDPTDALTKLAAIVQPEVGEYWIAAGLKFTSFELLDSVALLFLQFGRDFEINLLALSSAPLPKGVPPGEALAYVELALKATINPGLGIISVQAQLTPNSYVITKDCKLTGGFAFELWFKDLQTDKYKVNAGDFVVTLGGYHPAFKKPDWYPDVPRLGLTWKMEVSVGSIGISGGAYFALVPTAVMAGGYLNLTFDAGPLHAWLNASADFLVEWAPFYYVIDISISIGVAFEFSILGVSISLKVELGADLHLEGPPTHGYAHVSWYIISFRIPIGSDNNATDDNTLDWSGFADTFLPKHKPAQQKEMMHAAADEASDDVQPLKISVQTGQLQASGASCLVRAVPFALRIDSAIPTGNLTVAASNTTVSGPTVGVRPMGLTAPLDAPLTVTVQTVPPKDKKAQVIDLKSRGFKLPGVLNAAPASLWSQKALDRQYAPDSSTMLIPGALVGSMLDASSYVLYGNIAEFALENLAYDKGDAILLPFAKTPQDGPAERFPAADQQVAIARMKATITDPAVAQKREALFAALRASAMTAPANPSLTVTAAAAQFVVQAPPVLARPGVYQTTTISAGQTVTVKAPVEQQSVQTAAVRAPRLVGGIRRYRVGEAAPAAVRGLPQHGAVTSGRWVDAASGATSRQALRAFAADGQTSTLRPGAMALWETDPAGSHHVELAGDVPVRLACFDEFGELTGDQVVTAGGTHALPPRTGLVALHGIDDAHRPVIGWQHDTSLQRLNLYYATGERCLVRTQNIQRTRRKGRYVATGGTRGGHMVGNNQVTGRGRRLKPGWIETVLPGGRPSFAVALKGASANADALRVTAAQGDRPGLVGTDELALAASFAAGDVRVLVFATPQASATDYLSVITQPRHEGVQVLGVYAVDLAPEAVEADWEGHALVHSALDLAAADAPAGTRARIVAQPPKERAA